MLVNIFPLYKLDVIKKFELAEKTHSINSKIPEKIKKNLIFCIINLIKTVNVEIISKTNSFKILFVDADPLITVQKKIPKSINKLTGIVNIKKTNNKNAPNSKLNILNCKIIIKIVEITNKLIVKRNKKTKKK